MEYNNLINELEQNYPDKKVRSISTENRKLYDSISVIARKQGGSVGALLKDWGFEYYYGGIPFDPTIGLRLHNEFKVPYQRFAEWTGYTKQMISYLIKGYLNESLSRSVKLGNWYGTCISAEKIAMAFEMIKNRQLDNSLDGVRIILGGNCNGEVYLVAIDTDSVNVYFEDMIPASLLSKIRTIDYNSDDRIIKFLKANQVGDEVYISGHPANQWIRALASLRNISLYELVSQYGFRLAGNESSRRNLVFSR